MIVKVCIFAYLVFILNILTIGSDSLDTEDCSETECGSKVSKCMLLGACNCSITREHIRKNNCSCCTDCIKCLDKQYTQCCSCVGLCNTDKEAPRMNSYVDNLDQDEEALIVFNEVALVNKVGTTYSFPVFKEFKGDMKRMRETQKLRNFRADMSCTVVYLDKCLSHDQCSRQCLILGASMLRWFHTGCCECIGHTCLPYGSNTPRCKNCRDFGERPQQRHEL